MTIDKAIAREKELTDHCKKMLEGIEKDRQGSYDCGYDVGYNKAIDDFVKFANTMPTVETEDGTIRPMRLEEMAERLKRQNK